MSKLAGLTIIPDSLYVERGADSQLRSVIEKMGRPAYVLVARQMGKTNLLLHAKKTLSKPGDLFIYADVSNNIENLREFFQSLIDIMLQAGDFEDSTNEKVNIARARSGLLSAHMAHEKELRIILNAIPGKLVIFLDEVDALGKREYSDEVFAYIRSTYFAARTNFPEFHRLSYVLSGVAEPSDLIKNRDTSPFNIGQKIYLEDFSIEEFRSFCVKAELNFDETVLEEVYEWTGGNPRMSWDLLQKLEEVTDIVTPLIVKNVVQNLYLTAFDLPPIDHIRNLVEQDVELTSALISIHYGKGSSISDHVANKLYLAGITKAHQISEKLEFRNKIVLEALSLSWLEQVEDKSQTLLSRAYSAYKTHRWSDALELLQACYKETSNDTEKIQIALDIGVCMFRARKIPQSIEWLTENTTKKHINASLYYAAHYWIGLAHHNLKNEIQSYESFVIGSEQAAEGVNPYYYECLVNTCVYLMDDHVKHGDEIEKILGLVLNDPQKISDVYVGSGQAAQHLTSIAYWNFSQLRRKQGKIDATLKILNDAIGLSDPKFLIGFYLEKARLEEDKFAAVKVASECAEFVIEHGYIIERDSALYQFSLTLENASKLLAYLSHSSTRKQLESFYDYLLGLLKNEPEIFILVLDQAASFAISFSGTEAAAALCTLAYERRLASSDIEEARSFGTLALLLSSPPAKKLEQSYVDNYFKVPDAKLVPSDIRLVFSLVNGHLAPDLNNARRIDRAKSILTIANQLIVKVSLDTDIGLSSLQREIGKSIFSALSIETRFVDGEVAASSADAAQWLRQNKIRSAEKLPVYFGEEIMSGLISDMCDIASHYLRGLPVKPLHRKFGRNERVVILLASGKEVRGKFKDVSHLLSDEENKLVEADSNLKRNTQRFSQ